MTSETQLTDECHREGLDRNAPSFKACSERVLYASRRSCWRSPRGGLTKHGRNTLSSLILVESFKASLNDALTDTLISEGSEVDCDFKIESYIS